MASRKLTELDQRILAFSAQRVTPITIRQEFGWFAVTYYQRLFAIADNPAALEHDAVAVHRVQRMREEAASARSARTFERSA